MLRDTPILRHVRNWACLAIFFIPLPALAQQTVHVDDDACPGPGSGTAGDPYCSIQTAICDLRGTGGGTVSVNPGYYNESLRMFAGVSVVSTDGPTVTTIDGDIARGQKLYTVCAYCHGGDGMGRQALNAPRLSGSSDWYLARQLRHFKEGVRGAHPKDYYGYQMGLLSQTLQDEQAVDDIVAYINTL